MIRGRGRDRDRQGYNMKMRDYREVQGDTVVKIRNRGCSYIHCGSHGLFYITFTLILQYHWGYLTRQSSSYACKHHIRAVHWQESGETIHDRGQDSIYCYTINIVNY